MSMSGPQENNTSNRKPPNTRDEIPQPAVQFAASAGASVVSAVLLTPLDVIKTRLQTKDTSKGSPIARKPVRGVCSFFPTFNGDRPTLARVPMPEQLCYLCGRELQPAGMSKCNDVQWLKRPISARTVLCVSHPRKKGGNALLEIIRDIARYEGVGAFWKGTGPALAMAVPQVGIYLNTYDHVKRRLITEGYSLSSASIVAGSLARASSVTICSPLELVRMRLQADNAMRGHAVHAQCEKSSHKASGWFAIASKAMSGRGGVRALWQGLGPTLWRDVPFSATYWLVAERTRAKILLEGAPVAELGTEPTGNILRANMTAGFVGGTVASLVTHPFDVIKTQSQVRVGEYPRSTFAIGTHLLKEGGSGLLWRGLVPRLLKVAPSCAIVLTSYELLKKQLG